MNFDLSEEQLMLKDSVERYIVNQYDFDTRRAIASTDSGINEKVWQDFAELGWLSVPFSEDVGGFGGSAADSSVIMEELGRGLVLEPYLATVILFGQLIQKSQNSELTNTTLPKIISGELQGCFAYLERQSRFEITDIKTSAVKSGDSYTLNGEKTVVFNGLNADQMIVSARTSGNQFDSDGISLFLVDMNADGIKRLTYRLMDGQKVANITLNNVAVSESNLLTTEGEAIKLINEVVSLGILAMGAESLGVMEKLVETTVEYTKTRKQFGVPIGSFQALQHRMVDMFTAKEQTRSLLFRALCSYLANDDDFEKDLAALKIMMGRSGSLIGAESIQLHGGMGMTDELNVGHYAKRLMMINTTFGDADFQEGKFGRLALDGLD